MSSRGVPRRLAGLAVLTVLGVAPRVNAHGLQPAVLEVREQQSPGRFAITWTAALDSNTIGEEEHVELPARCRVIVAPIASEVLQTAVQRWSVACGSRGLAGERVGVSFPPDIRHVVILRVRTRDGPGWNAVLSPSEPSLQIPDAPGTRGASQSVRGYVTWGARHLATGYDHLLFVLCLMLLVRGAGPLLRAVTAFTLGHSATLALVALGLVHIPGAPVEALIAASVALLARNVAVTATAAPEALAATRRVASLAAGFGLVHGLGFAGTLAEIGLPREQRVLALAAFNLGIELGQLAFVGACLVAWQLLRRAGVKGQPRERLGLAYVLGAVASFWCIERLAAFWR